MDALLQDLRYAFRLMLRSPGFTLVAVLSLALGIGANAAMFSVVDATLLRPLPFRDPGRLVLPVAVVSGRGGEAARVDTTIWSYPKFLAMREGTRHVFQDVSAFGDISAALTGTGNPERLQLEIVSASYFRLLGVDAAQGRTFAAGEDSAANASVAVLGHELWMRRFGGDPGVLGRTIALDKQPVTVIGILPAGFRGLTGRGEVWVTTGMAPRLLWEGMITEPFAHWHEAVARLRPGVTEAQADRAMEAVALQLAERFPRPARVSAPGERWGASAVGLREARSDPLLRRAVVVLLCAVGFVLLIACANVANLLLARGAARRREMTVRLAVGAGRGRVVRQLLTESVVLALMGGALGVLIALWATDILSGLGPERLGAFGVRTGEVTDLRNLRVDARVLAFTLAVSLAAGVLFGVAPALAVTRPQVAAALKEAGAAQAGVDAPRRLGGRGALVAAEVALALVLLAGAGLMLRSFQRLASVETGVRAEGVLTASISPLDADYPETEDALALHAGLMERLAALPGVAAVTVSQCAPLSNACNGTVITAVDDRQIDPGSGEEVSVHMVGTDHFRVLGIRMMAGRAFTAADRPESPRVAVVSRSLARELWPGQDPVGRRLNAGMGNLPEDGAEVVGVVDDVRYHGLHDPPRPALYLADRQYTWPRAVFLIRSAGDPLALAPAVRREIRAVDADLPVQLNTLSRLAADAASRDRYGATLLSVFAGLALVLAAMGIHAVVAFSVARRTRELGVRQALGASPVGLVRMVVRQGAGVIGTGIAVGLAAALALTRVLRSLLYEVEPTDPLTLATITVFLAAVALLAAYLPARRAARVDPMVALRSE